MLIPIEDTFADIVGKAQRGLKIADSELAAQAGVSPAEVQSVRGGHFDAAVLTKVAPVLGLDANALVALPGYRPLPVQVAGLAGFNTPHGEMLVNSYVVWDAATRAAAAFDTGGDCQPMLDWIHTHGLTLQFIFLTHTHTDHTIALPQLRAETGARVFAGNRESIPEVETFEAGREFSCGSLQIGTRLTWGHSRGGTTYVVQGLERPVAIVGDAIFAGSMGGGSVSYADALETNRSQILSLPLETVLCPGHGPLTTVAEELRHNPFFAGLKSK